MSTYRSLINLCFMLGSTNFMLITIRYVQDRKIYSCWVILWFRRASWPLVSDDKRTRLNYSFSATEICHCTSLFGRKITKNIIKKFNNKYLFRFLFHFSTIFIYLNSIIILHTICTNLKHFFYTRLFNIDNTIGITK